MPNDYYRIPTSFGALLKREAVETLSERESIEQNIALYLGTKPGEFHYDPDYGCILYNFSFIDLNQRPKQDELKRTIETYLKNFDKRIELEKVDVSIQDITEQKNENKSSDTSRHIRIIINCRLKSTNVSLPEMKFDIIRNSY